MVIEFLNGLKEMSKPKKQIIRKQVSIFRSYDLDGTVSDALSFLAKLAAEHGPDLKIDSDVGDYSCSFDVYIEREETDEEYAVRIEGEKVVVKTQRERELAELKRLKEKYGQ